MSPQETKAAIATLKSELAKLENQLNEQRRQDEKLFVPEYYLHSVTYDRNGFDRIRCLRITLKPTQSTIDKQNELLATYGSFRSLDETKHSVGYVMDEGELVHTGGGYLLLNEGPIDNGEWKLLIAGEFNAINNRMGNRWGNTKLVRNNQ